MRSTSSSPPARSWPTSPTRLRSPQAGQLVFNPIFWLARQASDLPAWFVVGNDRIRTVVADMPDQQARLAVAERLARDLPGVDAMDEQQRAKATDGFASLTDGLTVRAMMQIRSIARRQDLPFAQIADAVRSYRVGIADNPWRQTYLYDRIRSGHGEITRSVKGQSQAVRRRSTFSSDPSPASPPRNRRARATSRAGSCSSPDPPASARPSSPRPSRGCCSATSRPASAST